MASRPSGPSTCSVRALIRWIAEFGVPELHPVNSYRIEKSYWQTPALVPGTVREYLLQGLEQAGDTVLPQVHCHQRFKPFVEDLLPDLVRGRQSLLAHPGDYPPCPRGNDGATLLVITHDPELADHCERVLTLGDGRIASDTADKSRAA